MAITSLKLDGVELENTAAYSASKDTAEALMATVPYGAVTVEMAGAPPYFIRSQIEARTIPLAVFIHGQTYTLRRNRYDTLAARFTGGLHTIQWTDGGVTRRLTVTLGPLLPSAWLSRAVSELTAWDPRPVVV